MASTLLAVLGIASAIAMTLACTCPNRTYQQIYCDSDFVSTFYVDGGYNATDYNLRVFYVTETSSFKASTLTHEAGFLLSPLGDNCDITLTVHGTYIIAGTIVQYGDHYFMQTKTCDIFPLDTTTTSLNQVTCPVSVPITGGY